jgi:hypothetical protein
MPRPIKYHTPEEKTAAHNARQRARYQANKVEARKQQEEWAKSKGFSSFTKYVQSTDHYKATCKHTPHLLKELLDGKPEGLHQCPTFPDYYINEEGKIFTNSKKRGGWIEIATQLTKGGYYTVQPYLNGKRYMRYIHSLVAETFIGPRPIGMEIDHIDADKSNNKASNLQYITRKQNLAKRNRVGRKKNK